jgi:hypothetical protein
MGDKSPHDNHSAKKSSKTLKAKRTARRAEKGATVQMQQLMHPHKNG